MPERVPPNPPSPFATADPAFRHLFAEMMFFGPPAPGVLAFAGCDQLAVVPDEPLREADPSGALPEGICPACMQVAQGGSEPDDNQTPQDCRLCESSGPDGLCAMCRIEMHEHWVASGRPDGITLDQAVDQVILNDHIADGVREHFDEKEAGR
jgi:hypothetical protein